MAVIYFLAAQQCRDHCYCKDDGMTSFTFNLLLLCEMQTKCVCFCQQTAEFMNKLIIVLSFDSGVLLFFANLTNVTNMTNVTT